jgi:hypothetical protein
MSLPNEVGPKLPLSCSYCKCDETCVGFNLLGQQLELWKIAAGLYSAGMYRIACRNNETEEIRDVGGLVDVGDNVLNFIPGNVISLNENEVDKTFKKYILPGLGIGIIIMSLLIIVSVVFKK